MYSILLIDGVRQRRKQMKKMILDHCANYTVAGEAVNGYQGIQMIREIAPDIVILTQHMTFSDGFEVLNEFREKPVSSSFITLFQCSPGQRTTYPFISGTLEPDFTVADLKRELDLAVADGTAKKEFEPSFIHSPEKNAYLIELTTGISKKRLGEIVGMKMLNLRNEEQWVMLIKPMKSVPEFSVYNQIHEYNAHLSQMQKQLKQYDDGEVFIYSKNLICLIANKAYQMNSIRKFREFAVQLYADLDSEEYLLALSQRSVKLYDVYKTVNILLEVMRYHFFFPDQNILDERILEHQSSKNYAEELPQIIDQIRTGLSESNSSCLELIDYVFLTVLKECPSFDLYRYVLNTLTAFVNVHAPYTPLILKNEESVIRVHEEIRRHFELLLKNTMYTLTHPAVKKAYRFIQENYYNKNLRLTDAAEYASINPDYLSSLFPIETGKNFSDILNEIRINHACMLLRAGNYRITEVAELVGFNNPKYFSQVFKKLKNCNPKEYQLQK